MKQKFFSLKNVIGFLFLITIMVGSSFAVIKKDTKNKKDEWELAEQKDLDKAKCVDMRLPINFSVRPEIALSVKIPEDFRSYLPLEQMIKSTMNEFFPKKDKNIDNWAEIITTQIYIGQCMTAKWKTDFIKNRILSNAADVKMINEQENTCTSYSTSEFTMAYTNQGRREVIFGKYYSGPYDCSGFQYTIRLLTGLSEGEALKKINDFVKNQVSLSGKFDPLTEPCPN